MEGVIEQHPAPRESDLKDREVILDVLYLSLDPAMRGWLNGMSCFGFCLQYFAFSSADTGYPCGNFSGTSSLKFRATKGSIGHTFMVCIHTENQNQGDFYPFVLLEISVLHESPLGHLRYGLTDVPPQPNSPPDNVFNPDRPVNDLNARNWAVKPSSASLNK